ncbi:MAG: hypothetical protein KGZ25_09745, partial [Planctomycetes bacterium]|nr:hypothetical protein [Planctomycetota bacterium]
ALESAVGEAHLPPKKFPSVADAEKHLKDVRAKFERLKREDAERGKVRTAECEVFGAEERLTMARAQESGELRKIQEVYGRAEVQVFRMGDTAVVGFPGECFVEYALEVKSEAPSRVFVASLANGELQGYITTPGASGYEADLSLFKPKAGARMVEKALDLLEDACGEGDTV